MGPFYALGFFSFYRPFPFLIFLTLIVRFRRGLIVKHSFACFDGFLSLDQGLFDPLIRIGR